MRKFIDRLIILVLAYFIVIPFSMGQTAGFQLPEYEKFTLNNGLTVYMMQQAEVPTISFSALIPAGAIQDGENSGISFLTAAALQFGTENYSKSEIEEALDFIGANLNSSSTKEYAQVSARFASKDTETVLPIIKEVITAPKFDAEEVEKERKRMISNLERDRESPRSVISSYWEKFLFADHAYGNPARGTVSTVESFTASDLESFYQQHYAPDNSAIALVGDFDLAEMKTKIEEMFSSWEKTSGNNSANLNEPELALDSSRVMLVNKGDARETTFLIGGKGVKRDNPDYVAIQVVNTVLGGRFTSWLNDELRVNTGLTYGANSRFTPMKYAGTFAISTFTATENTEETIDRALQVYERMHSEGIDEETLTSAKNYVKGQFPPNYETSRQLAGLLTQMFWYGFDENYINTFQANVEELDTQKAQQIIEQYFPKENLQFLLIGKSEDIKSIAQKYGEVVEKEITEDGF
ncbi:insulinase family protein [Litoribacter ruber]|uniref:Insulinase family protein n=1 Tax=Litoribacter ruber TaxID=702568 RepID=A0AAP2CJV5_9BACT|nr:MULTISPECIES: pitrilysin family protein [Litoribacter]MBS9524546.1 insulinase family protein [Litoribacter alkaliphilus]MBT0810294.1 insulinase family protein [Litoribacter ruber]